MSHRFIAALILSSPLAQAGHAEPPGMAVEWEWEFDSQKGAVERAYLYVDDPTAFVFSVTGTPDFPMSFEWCPGHTFYQHPFGSDLAPNGSLVAVFPSLAFDSFVSIGKMTSAGDFTQLSPNWPGFLEGGMSGTDIGWFVTPGLPQTWPVNNRVFLGQFAAFPWGTLQAQFVVEVMVDGEVFQVQHTHVSYGSSCRPGDEIRYDLVCEVIDVHPTLDGIAEVGEIINGQYRFHDLASDAAPDPDVGLYFSNTFIEQGLALVTDLGGASLYQSGPGGPVTVINGKVDSYTAPVGGGYSHELGEFCLELRLIDSTGTAFDSDSLLGGDPMTLSDFDSAELEIWYYDTPIPNTCGDVAPSILMRVDHFCPTSTDDCNGNGVIDTCEGFPDFNDDDINDWCQCLGDIEETGDNTVGVGDLLVILANWGPCDCKTCPAADLDGDCNVGTGDLLTLLALWGPCGQ